MSYITSANIEGFNPFTDARNKFNPAYKSLVWKILLQSLNEVTTGLDVAATTNGSLFNFILNKHIDFPTVSGKKYSSLIQAFLTNQQNSDDVQSYWNPSMKLLFDNLFRITNPELYNGTDPENSLKIPFRIWDIMNANAGYSFLTEPWVIPWRNRLGTSYTETRQLDILFAALRNKSNLQYTNGNEYEHAATEAELKHSSLSFSNGAMVFTDDTSGTKFNKIDYISNDGVIHYTYDEEIGDSEITGVRLLNGLIAFLNQAQITSIVSEKDKWIRLLMPMYLRNVEIEDLNRNFWVIGQVLDLILFYLYDPNGPLGKAFKNMAQEIEEMWNNIEYLWGAVIANGKDEYPNPTWHTELIQLTPWLPQSAHLYNKNQLKSELADTTAAATDRLRKAVVKALDYFKGQYKDQNIALLPVVDANFYEQNYHSKIYLPGLLIFQRFKQDSSTQKVEKIESPEFKWYEGIAANSYTFDEISGGSFGSGFFDDGYNFHYSSINAAKSDDQFYGAFRPRFWITNNAGAEYNFYQFNQINLPDTLALNIRWTDAGLRAMTGQDSRKGDVIIGEQNVIQIIPDINTPIAIPYGGLDMGELVSKKIPQDIFILPREFRVPVLYNGSDSYTMGDSTVSCSSDITAMMDTYQKMSDIFAENIYNYISKEPDSFNTDNSQAYISNLSSDNSSSSVWVFRLASIEAYSSLVNDSAATKISLEQALLNKNVDFIEPHNLYSCLFTLDSNNNMYYTRAMTEVPTLKYRSNATLYNPLNGLIRYKCRIVNIHLDDAERKNFVVVSNGPKLTSTNWAVLFIYGRNIGQTENPREDVITIFYPNEEGSSIGNCETIRYQYSSGQWTLYDYHKNNDSDSSTITNSYWNSKFPNLDNIYHNRVFSPDNTGGIYTGSLNTFMPGLGDRLVDTAHLISKG